MKKRSEWLDKLIKTYNSPSGRDYADRLQEELRKHSPQFLDEIKGMADGASISYDTMWAMSIKSEMAAFPSEPPGCSTIFYQAGTEKWLFHNEDGDVAYKDDMFILKAHPPSGVSFLTFVYPGLIPGVGPGFNSKGVIQSTNFIGCLKPGIGIPRYFLGRAILEAESLEDAVNIATSQPRAFPWHHNLASFQTGEYYSVETLPDGRSDTLHTHKNLYIHTNHLLHHNLLGYEHQDTEYAKLSSHSRYEVLTELKNKAPKEISGPEFFLKWLSSRKKAPYSPCRVADEISSGQTLGTAYFDLNKKFLRLYKGPPCEALGKGLYHDYTFGSFS